MSSHSILELIPHRAPMVLLDEMIEHGPEHLSARMTVNRDKPFVDDSGAFPAWAGIELMAQAIAAFGGLATLSRGEPAKIGFLLGSRRYDSECESFPDGTVLTVLVRRLILNEQGLGVFECRIDSAVGAVTANVSVFQPDDPERFVREVAA